MWKRDEAVKPTAPEGSGPAPAQPGKAPLAAEAAPTRPATAGDLQRGQEKTAVNIGKSVVIKGELNGSEDLTIEGQVEGKIELRQNVLTIGANGRIKAQVFAKAVIILGEVTGNVTATEKVDIRDNGSVDGDIAAPRVAIAEGAHFRGSIDMQKGTAPKADTKSTSPSTSTSAPTPSPAASPTTTAATSTGSGAGSPAGTATPAGVTR
jgi:cytoskeletal protein CcmA (bactofilin family)